MRIRTAAALIAALFALPGALSAQYLGSAALPSPKGIKNVILIVPDGMSAGAVSLARWYSGGAPLAVDALASGLVRTYNADTPIADSAPAATAFATGYKTNTPFIGVLPEKAGMPGVPAPKAEDVKRPVASVLEAARLAGKATGLIATCELPHATPADFAAHDPSRKAYDDILEQMVYNGLDVAFGGGFTYLSPATRKDKEDLGAALRGMGYQYVQSAYEFENLKAGKAWGLFAPVAMAYDLDRDPAREPSLAEMTKKAIELLSGDKEGFFLMVEGSKIDWAAHANDPAGIVSDVLAWDASVRVALDFAKGRKDTIVVSVSDHGNSGITIGDASTSSGYFGVPLAAFFEPLKRAKLTGEGLEAMLDAESSNAKAVLADWFGIADATEEELAAVRKAAPGSLNYVVGPMLAKRAKIGFTTTGHTGEETVLYAYAPDPAARLSGTVENTDIARYIAKALGLDLAKTTAALFVEAEAAFAAKGAKISVDASNAANPVLVAEKGGLAVLFPRNKNYAIVGAKLETKDGKSAWTGGEMKALDGVTVLIADTGKWYLGKKAVELIK
ncbi:MAG: alkaline phosphatase [Spirochaetaceae bacterium]|nr:alkaline phosphatase [Spirochaetaceae bacterium]